MQWTRSQVCLLWFLVVFAVVEFFSSFCPFLPGSWCVVFATMTCWFYVAKVWTSLAFLSKITESDVIFDDRECLSAIFVTLGSAILVFIISEFKFCTSQLNKESGSLKESYSSCRESKIWFKHPSFIAAWGLMFIIPCCWANLTYQPLFCLCHHFNQA